eukprot:scaffold5962_cov103-Isochrysis_galbana.AAC.3
MHSGRRTAAPAERAAWPTGFDRTRTGCTPAIQRAKKGCRARVSAGRVRVTACGVNKVKWVLSLENLGGGGKASTESPAGGDRRRLSRIAGVVYNTPGGCVSGSKLRVEPVPAAPQGLNLGLSPSRLRLRV